MHSAGSINSLGDFQKQSSLRRLPTLAIDRDAAAFLSIAVLEARGPLGRVAIRLPHGGPVSDKSGCCLPEHTAQSQVSLSQWGNPKALLQKGQGLSEHREVLADLKTSRLGDRTTTIHPPSQLCPSHRSLRWKENLPAWLMPTSAFESHWLAPGLDSTTFPRIGPTAFSFGTQLSFPIHRLLRHQRAATGAW